MGRAGVVTAPRLVTIWVGAPTSATVPHAWHSGQRPCQRTGVAPHSPQRKAGAGARFELGLVTVER